MKKFHEQGARNGYSKSKGKNLFKRPALTIKLPAQAFADMTPNGDMSIDNELGVQLFTTWTLSTSHFLLPQREIIFLALRQPCGQSICALGKSIL